VGKNLKQENIRLKIIKKVYFVAENVMLIIKE